MSTSVDKAKLIKRNIPMLFIQQCQLTIRMLKILSLLQDHYRNMCGPMQVMMTIIKVVVTILHVPLILHDHSSLAFVYNNYYCELGDVRTFSGPLYYLSNPLWDGKDCGNSNSCCAEVGMPWFYRKLQYKTSRIPKIYPLISFCCSFYIVLCKKLCT